MTTENFNTNIQPTEAELADKLREEAFNRFANGEEYNPNDPLGNSSTNNTPDNQQLKEQNDPVDMVDDLEVDETDVEEQHPSDSRDSGTKKPRGPYYKNEYEKLKKETDAAMSLTHSRLRQVSDLYQSTKQELLALREQLETKQMSEADPFENLPENLKDAIEMNPDIAELIKYAVKESTSKVQKKAEDTIKSKVGSVEDAFIQDQIRRAHAYIRTVHPDIDNLLQSGDLISWINSLDPVSRTGAVYIYERGTPDEVITLVNNFKHSKGMGSSNNEHYSRQSPASNVPVSTPQQAGSGSESRQAGPGDSQTQKLKAALSVPTNRALKEFESYKTPEEVFNAVSEAYDKRRNRNAL